MKNPKEFKCYECEEVFNQSWKYERHIKLHTSSEQFNCSECDQTFYVKWRMKKHIQSHDKARNYCHYFNNNKYCPFEEIGCKFRHEDSSRCKYGKCCQNRLCQFKHEKKWKCETCKKEFVSDDELQLHIENIHAKHKCNECEFRATYEELDKHESEIH